MICDWCGKVATRQSGLKAFACEAHKHLLVPARVDRTTAPPPAIYPGAWRTPLTTRPYRRTLYRAPTDHEEDV